MFKKVIIYTLLLQILNTVSANSAETVYSYDDLLTALTNENADVILDMNGAGIDLDGGNGITIGEGQTVVFKNIGTEGQSAWTDTTSNIVNKGTVEIDSVIFKENNTLTTDAYVGSVLKNNDSHVVAITNSVFDSNIAENSGAGSLWGGIVLNGKSQTEMTNAVIDLIENVSFTNNTTLSGKAAPHGGVILNLFAKIGTIDKVLFENNTMTGPSDQSGGAHGVGIDNNEGGFIEKITNSTFRNNYSYRTGTQEFSPSTNYHASGGAMDNYHYIGEISSCVFEGNHTSAESVSASTTGGAIMNVAFVTDTNLASGYIGKIVDTKFINNHVESVGSSQGGAIATGNSGEATSAEIGEITNVLFSGNYASSTMQYAYGGAIENDGKIGATTAFFYNNYVKAQRNESGYFGAYGGAIVNFGEIAALNSVFVGNYAENTSGASSAAGGAIYNRNGEGIGEIIGNFEKNYAKATGSNALGGAIYNNNSNIASIYADFVSNYAISSRDGSTAFSAYGGAIMNQAKIGVIKSNFIRNYVENTSGSNSAGGGAIYNRNGDGIDEIIGNFERNYALSNEGNVAGGAIYNNSSTINIIKGNFDSNYAIGLNSANGGAINNNNKGVIGEIIGNFTDNYIESTGEGNATGGAIVNFNQIDSIIGNFVNNYAKSVSGNAIGGAIRNAEPSSETALGIGEISGDFINNYAESESSQALGGAIYNTNTLGNIKNSSFINNSVKGNEESAGGAIYSSKDILITADNGVALFEGNTANGKSNAIYMKGTEAVEDEENPVEKEIINLNLSSLNNGNITFNDAIDGQLYNINISGDGTGVVRFDNEVKNVGDFVLGDNSVTHIGLKSKVFAQNMKPESLSENSPIITVDVKVDRNKNTVKSGQIHVDNDIEGEYRVLVNALTPDVLNKTEDAVVPFLFAPNDDEGTASSFAVARVIGSPYMWDGAVNAEGETEGATWYLNLTDKRNPEYVPQKGYPVVPEIVAGIGLQSAAIEQTRSVVRNVKNKVDVERDFCPKCGFYDNGWHHRRLNNGWVLAQSESANIDAPSDVEAKIHGVEAGLDFQGDFHNTLGVFVSYRNGEYEFSGKGEEYFSRYSSDTSIDSYLAGLYYRYDRNLAWLFATIYGGMQKTETRTGDGVAEFDTQGTEFGASIEFGQAMPLTRTLTLDPSVGLYYTQVNFDDTDDNVGKHYEWEDIKYLEAEVGAKLEQQFRHAKVYIKPSVIKTLVNGNSVFITGVNKVNTQENDTLGRIEIGGRFAISEGLTGYGWANYTFGSDYDALAFGAGLNYAW